MPDEAKPLGLTRRIRVTRQQLRDLVLHVLNRRDRKTKDRAERQAMKRALTQIGAMEIWDLAKREGGLSEKELRDKIRPTQIREVTVDAIAIVLDLVGELDMASSMILVDLEEALLDAKDGRGLVPDGEVDPPWPPAPLPPGPVEDALADRDLDLPDAAPGR